MLLAALIVGDDLLADVGEREPRRPAGQRDPARRAVHDQARPDLRLRRRRSSPRTRIKKVGGQTLYFRRYPQGGLVLAPRRLLDPVALARRPRASLNDYLTGSNANLGTVLKTTLDKMQRRDDQGQRRLADDRSPARSAWPCSNWPASAASVVAIDPRNGQRAGRWPRGRPTTRTWSRSDFARINNIRAAVPTGRAAAEPRDRTASTRRARPSRSSRAPPRSTRASSRSTRRFFDPGYCIEYGKQVQNCGDQSGPETFGRVDFLQAFEHSINSVFCNIGKAIGAGRILDYAKQFGFYEDPPLETPEQRALAERPLQARQALLPEATRRPRSTRAGSRSARSGCSRRRCRWRWSRRRSATAA